MTDTEAITALLHEYAYRLDAGDLDGVAEMFRDAELRSTNHDLVRRGTTEAREIYDAVELGPDGTPGTMHQISNVMVNVDGDGDTASARCYFTVLQVTTQGLHPILAGEYLDRFRRVDGEWRFAERKFAPKLMGDLSRHMKGRIQ